MLAYKKPRRGWLDFSREEVMTSTGNGILLGLVVALISSLGPYDAHADLYSAEVAYNKHDFEAAFQQFRELAELGQPQAQYNLAVMYAKGGGDCRKPHQRPCMGITGTE
jgi:hypothetical protein